MRWLGALRRRVTPRDAQAALLQLLQLPDPADLGPRRYRYTQPRDPRRDPDVLKRDLGTAYVQHVRQTFGQDISGVVSFRRSASSATVTRFRKAGQR